MAFRRCGEEVGSEGSAGMNTVGAFFSAGGADDLRTEVADEVRAETRDGMLDIPRRDQLSMSFSFIPRGRWGYLCPMVTGHS